MKAASSRIAVLELLRLAESPGLYRPVWSDAIIIETMRALERQIGVAPSKKAYSAATSGLVGHRL